jgi:hypothetical protein
MRQFIDLLGWYGALAIITGYFLVSFSYLESTSLYYQLLNATGAIGIVVISIYKKAYQPAVLNIVWVCIAVFAILGIMF